MGRLLPDEPTIADLGCGPGLFLRDLSERHSGSHLYGFDLPPAMIEHAQRLRLRETPPIFSVHNVEQRLLPLDADSVDLVSMVRVMQFLDDPFAALAEVRQVLRPRGLFLLDDWVRMPLAQYVQTRPRDSNEALAYQRSRWLRMFPIHNKY